MKIGREIKREGEKRIGEREREKEENERHWWWGAKLLLVGGKASVGVFFLKTRCYTEVHALCNLIT